eukprot:GHVN01045664.1.p1 GENE.GHVN01045664.1~~GHVN01045664.1.p1  ORF type:complete len:138 (-),score=17.68 GHVN01045664.1:69-482(-)
MRKVQTLEEVGMLEEYRRIHLGLTRLIRRVGGRIAQQLLNERLANERGGGAATAMKDITELYDMVMGTAIDVYDTNTRGRSKEHERGREPQANTAEQVSSLWSVRVICGCVCVGFVWCIYGVCVCVWAVYGFIYGCV